jgi:two-component sensor histidine kinase
VPTGGPLAATQNRVVDIAIHYALAAANDGRPLPEDFDCAVGNGLGMKIIRTYVDQRGGELRVGRNDDNQGARFTVLFAKMSARTQLI